MQRSGKLTFPAPPTLLPGEPNTTRSSKCVFSPPNPFDLTIFASNLCWSNLITCIDLVRETSESSAVARTPCRLLLGGNAYQSLSRRYSGSVDVGDLSYTGISFYSSRRPRLTQTRQVPTPITPPSCLATGQKASAFLSFLRLF